MTFDEIAQNITPVGYTVAIIGVLLSIAVLVIRFRERNLLLEKEKAERMKEITAEKNRSMVEDEFPAEKSEQNSTFKTFTPAPSESSEG